MLDRKRTRVLNERSARKQPLTDSEVRALLRKVGTVVVARGKKAKRMPARTVSPSDLKGPTGNFRAPMILKGKTLLVGFSAETLDALI